MSSQFDLGSESGGVEEENRIKVQSRMEPNTYGGISKLTEPLKQEKVSNLTKNLLSSQQMVLQPPMQEKGPGMDIGPQSAPGQANKTVSMSFSGSGNSESRYVGGSHFGSISSNVPHSLDFPGAPSNQFTNFSYPNQPLYFNRRGSNLPMPNPNESNNYIPSGHNTPTVVSTSYSSNHSYSSPFQSAGSFVSQKPSTQVPQYGQQNNAPNEPKSGSFKPTNLSSIGIPTTNVSMDSASSTQYFSSYQNSRSSTTNSLNNPNYEYDKASSYQNRYQYPSSNSKNMSSLQPTNDLTQKPPSYNQLYQEPDHYMTYQEFYRNLCAKDKPGEEGEHLCIVDYPVNDLILMLASLLTKIVEANDKLHPNHFDNTINARQKLKEQKRLRKMEKLNQRKEGHMEEDIQIRGHESMLDSDDSDDDEMKNKYLANVLAFHGTNIPGISLHAYLVRILKYCPVTNEVFLSLLVYFDRIAKKANNLRSSKHSGDFEGDGQDAEQLFVMDSYNIHRLIISGITVSSKFFSDIFYKNLRYAKVGGLPLEELNYLEVQFLLLLEFKLMISVEDLQNYGDLLLRFWKREQIADELVNGAHIQGERNSQEPKS